MKQTITFKQLTKFEDLEIIIKQVNCVAKPNKIIINVMLSCHGINQSFSGVCNNLEMFDFWQMSQNQQFFLKKNL